MTPKLIIGLYLLAMGTLHTQGEASILSQGYVVTAAYGALYLATAVVLLGTGAQAIALLKTAWALLALLLLTLSSLAWSTVPARWLLANGHLLALILIGTMAALKLPDLRDFASLTYLSCVLILAASLATVVFLPELGIDRIRDDRWRGITVNPNTLGVVAVLAIWAATVVFLLPGTTSKKALVVATLPVVAICLFGTNSITSLLTASAIVGATISLHLCFAVSDARRWVRLTCLIGLPLLGLLTLYVVAPGLLQSETVLQSLGRSSNLTGRTELWNAASELFNQRLWLGWSYDSFATLNQHIDASVVQFHNGYIDLSVRLGLSGLILMALLIMHALARGLRRVQTAPLEAACWIALILGILLHNVAEGSLLRDRNYLWFMFVVAYLNLARPGSVPQGLPETSAAPKQQTSQPLAINWADTEFKRPSSIGP